MKKIFYGLAGEGLGHASRTQAVLEQLPDDFEVHLFTFGQAYQLFEEINYPYLHKIKGTMYHSQQNGISIVKTLWANRSLLLSKWKDNVDEIQKLNDDIKPDLYITDFEPSIARAAHRSKIPLLSIDNQHRFSHCYKKELSWKLHVYSTIIGATTCFFIPEPDKIIITTFHKEFLEPCAENVIIVDGIVRNSIEQQKISNDNFVLVYARHGFGESILKSLMNCDDTHFRIYGSSKGVIQNTLSKRKNFEFFPLSQEFVKDLARCNKVIGPSGHQLLTEVKYLGKPILTIPQNNQWEQYANAFYVEKSEMGKCCHVKQLNYDVIEDFLNREITSQAFSVNGVHKVIEVIQSYF